MVEIKITFSWIIYTGIFLTCLRFCQRKKIFFGEVNFFFFCCVCFGFRFFSKVSGSSIKSEYWSGWSYSFFSELFEKWPPGSRKEKYTVLVWCQKESFLRYFLKFTKAFFTGRLLYFEKTFRVITHFYCF